MAHLTTEWVVVPGNVAIIARDTGEAWVMALDDYDETLPFARPMTGEGARGSTAAILNAAIAHGFRDSEGAPVGCSISLTRHAFNLIGAYHNARRTPGNFRAAARRFRSLDRVEVADFLDRHAREETGHDRLALKDLRALGLPAERVVENLVPDGQRSLSELFDRLSFAAYPIGCIGYCYCFERIASLKQKADVDAVQAICPDGVDATRFLRTHSALGSEVDHVDDLVDFIAGLPAADRTAIVQATYQTAVLLANGGCGDDSKSDAAMLSEIQAAAGGEIHLPA